MRQRFIIRVLCTIFLLPGLLCSKGGLLYAGDFLQATHVNLPIKKVTARHGPYADFCRRTPSECRLTGASTIRLTQQTNSLLNQVNAQVNSEILFALDTEQYNQEEYWTLPHSGWGDCEDIALEKRHRLVKLGFPSTALRLAIVFHKKKLNSHALLTVETTKGTYVMNSFTDKVTPWHLTPYNFESRERPSGRWEHYDQTHWTYEP